MLLINFFRLVVPLPFRDLLIRLYFHLLDQRQLGTLRCFDIWCQIHYCSLFENLSIRRRNFFLLGVGTYFCAGNQSIWFLTRLLLALCLVAGKLVPSEIFARLGLSMQVLLQREKGPFGPLVFFPVGCWTVWKIFAFLRIEPKYLLPLLTSTQEKNG